MTRRSGIAVLLLCSSCSLRDLSDLDVCFLGKCHRAEVERDGPLLWLRFGESEGPVAFDQAGDRNGTYPESGVTFGAPGAIAGEPDTAVSFDGTSAISMPAGFDFDGDAPFTLEVWVRQPTISEDYVFAIDHASYETSRDGWDLLLLPDKVNFERWSGDSSIGIVGSAAPLTVETFHHIVVTFDGTEVVLYIDSEVAGPLARVEVFGLLPALNNGWSIGKQNCACQDVGFVGSLDELAIYPTALTQERITAHYRAAGR